MSSRNYRAMKARQRHAFKERHRKFYLRRIVRHKGGGSHRGERLIWLQLECGHTAVRRDRGESWPFMNSDDVLVGDKKARCYTCVDSNNVDNIVNFSQVGESDNG